MGLQPLVTTLLSAELEPRENTGVGRENPKCPASRGN